MLTLPQEAAIVLPNSRALVHIISNLGKGLRECLISSSYVPNTTSCPFSTAAIYKRITTIPHPPPHTQAESITHVTCAASNKELNASNQKWMLQTVCKQRMAKGKCGAQISSYISLSKFICFPLEKYTEIAATSIMEHRLQC